MKKEVRTEGTPFTRRRVVVHRTESGKELRRGLTAMKRRLEDPWEQQRPIINWVRQALITETAALGPTHQFRPREDIGWYLNELDVHARIGVGERYRPRPDPGGHVAADPDRAGVDLRDRSRKEEMIEIVPPAQV